MATGPSADIRVIDVPDRSRFEISVDREVAGFTEYRRRPGLIRRGWFIRLQAVCRQRTLRVAVWRSRMRKPGPASSGTSSGRRGRGAQSRERADAVDRLRE